MENKAYILEHKQESEETSYFYTLILDNGILVYLTAHSNSSEGEKYVFYWGKEEKIIAKFEKSRVIGFTFGRLNIVA